jgi:hypothetical protein
MINYKTQGDPNTLSRCVFAANQGFWAFDATTLMNVEQCYFDDTRISKHDRPIRLVECLFAGRVPLE